MAEIRMLCSNQAKTRSLDSTAQQSPPAPKTQVFEVAVPPGVGPNEQFSLVANGQRVSVTCPPNVSSGQKIRFQLPKPLRIPVIREREKFPLFCLPIELIARILIFLPSGLVTDMRLLCQALAEAGKIAVHAKLLEAGVEGKDFKTLTTNARSFLEQNRRVWGVLADQRCVAWKRQAANRNRVVWNEPRRYNWGEVPFFPRNLKTSNAEKIRSFIDSPNLADKFALRRQTADGRLIMIGVKLSNVPLRVRAPVKHYLEELEHQRATIPATLFVRDAYLDLMGHLDRKIKEMRGMNSNGSKFAFVSYIPKLRLRLRATTYDKFVAETTTPLSAHSLLASGIGRGDDCAVGTNLNGLQLAFKVPVEEIDDLYELGTKNIADKTTRNLERLKLL